MRNVHQMSRSDNSIGADVTRHGKRVHPNLEGEHRCRCYESAPPTPVRRALTDQLDEESRGKSTRQRRAGPQPIQVQGLTSREPNDEVERRGNALPANEAALSQSSIPSLAHRRCGLAIARTDC